MNQHTCGAIFNAYALANRLDLALDTWNELEGRGFDIGPFGSSALIKACARARDIGAALQVGWVDMCAGLFVCRLACLMTDYGTSRVLLICCLGVALPAVTAQLPL
jgi:pentatricopeptide repeat protein